MRQMVEILLHQCVGCHFTLNRKKSFLSNFKRIVLFNFADIPTAL